MHFDSTENPDAGLKVLAITDYVAAEVVEDLAPQHVPAGETHSGNGTPPQIATAGYGDRPSRAWLRTPRQFVLIKAQHAAVPTAAFSLARDLVAEAERISRGRPAAREQLMVRGIALRGPARATVYLDLVCATGGAAPYLDLRAIQERLERRAWTVGGSPIALLVKAEVVPMEGSLADPLDDCFYERVRPAIGW